MPFEISSVRLWKRLTPSERLAASTHFWAQPPEALVPSALAVIVQSRRIRPQTARSLSSDERTRALASVLDPGETVAAFLLVALHLGERRVLLGGFLDAVGLPHEDGVLTEEADSAPIPSEATVEKAVRAMAAAHPVAQVETYLNTLWLQDPDRWGALSKSGEWLSL
jgi:hypothetical protein